MYYHFIKEATAEEREKFDSGLYAPARGSTSSLMETLAQLTEDE